MKRASVVAWMLLAPLSILAQQPDRSIQAILDGVAKRAGEARQEDQRLGLQMLQRAEGARRAGRLEEATGLARRAQQLFPDSVEIRRVVNALQNEQREARAQAARLDEATAALDEANAYAAELMMEDRRLEARELLVAVRKLTSEFPAGMDLTTTRAAAEKQLAAIGAVTASEPWEQIQVSPQALPDPLSPSEMRLLLARRISIDWRGEPLRNAFVVIRQETGLLIRVDPYLERLGVFEQVPADVRIVNAPVERLLRMVTNMAGASYVLQDGEVHITTKGNALGLALARGPDRLEAPVIRRATQHPTPLLPSPPPAKAAGYLISGEALCEHVRELLRMGHKD